MSRLESAAADLGAFLVELTKKHELTYDEIVLLMGEYGRSVRRHKAKWELAQLKERFGS